MPSTFCGFSPKMFVGRKPVKLLQGTKPPEISKVPKDQKEIKSSKKENSSQSSCNFILMMELRKKIITFRHIIDLPSLSNTSCSTDQLLIGTMKDLHKSYPENVPHCRISDMKKLPLDKVLIYFCKALQGLGDTSKMNDEWIDKYKYDIYDNDKCKDVDKLVEIAVATLDGLIKIAKEKFDMIDDDDENKEFRPEAKTFGKVLKESYSDSGSSCPSPVTPTSVLPELTNGSPKSSYSSSALLPLRVQAVGKLNPIDVKRLALDMLPKVRVRALNSLNQKKITTVEKQKKEAKGNSPVRKASTVVKTRDSTSQNKSSEVPLSNSNNTSGDKTKLMLNVAQPSSPSKMQPSELLKDNVIVKKSPLPSPAPKASSPSSSPSASPLPSMLPKVRVHVPNSLKQKKAAIEKQKKEGKGNSPVRKVSNAAKTRDSTSQNKASEVPLPKLNNACGDKSKFSPNVALPSSPSKMQPSLLKDKVVAKKSPSSSPSASTLPTPSAPASALQPPSSSPSASTLSPPSAPASALQPPSSSPSASTLPPPSAPASALQSPSSSPSTPASALQSPSPSSPSRRAKSSTDVDTDIRLLPLPPGPSSEVLSPPPPSKLSTDMGVHIRSIAPLVPLPEATAPPLLQPNVASGGPTFPPPPMLQPNVEVLQAILVATEPQMPTLLSMLTHTTAGGIPLPLPRSPPPSLKPNVATGPPLLPPPPVPSQAKVVATGAPLPPPSLPLLGTTSPMMLSKGSGQLPPPPPPPMAPVNGVGTPPPPPPGATKSLRPKKVNTKLKRSSHMGNLYRVLRGKVEGCPMKGKSSSGKTSGVGSIPNGKQGLSDALAEMTKRSAYFQQIEEDVEKYAKSITELKTDIITFTTNDMTKLIKFHKHVESILENLTDETQVPARFEGFPTKKLEALRTAAGLYSKLESMISGLQNLKVEPPLVELLDKVDRHFNKIKGEIDALERTKDEESQKFKSHNIDFDFQILVRIKEAMVDVSSNCMELAMKERREAKLRENDESKTKAEAQKKVCVKMLWRAFQLAFRVYTFAGGHDDRADNLSRELADEIQTDPQHQTPVIIMPV